MKRLFKDVSNRPPTITTGPVLDRPREAEPFTSQPLDDEVIAEGWVTSYEVVDKVGDVGTYGMFALSLDRYRREKRRIPVTEAHDWTTRGVVGYVLPNEIVEVPTGGPGGKGGLYARIHLITSTPAGAILAKLIDRVPFQMSYAFDSVSEKRQKDGSNRLLVVDLLEVSICLFGAVSETTVQAVKQREAIMALPEFQRFVREKRLRDLELLEASPVLADRPHRRGGHHGHSIEAQQRDRGKSDPVAEFDTFCMLIGRKDLLEVTSETGAGPLVTQGEAPPPVVEPDYRPEQRDYRCVGCGRFTRSEVHHAPRGLYNWTLCENCGALNIFPARAASEKTIRETCRKTAEWVRANYNIVEEVFDPEAGYWVRWKVLEDTDLDDDDGKSTDEDRAETLFRLDDRRHTQIAVGIVFGPEEERNGKPLDRWTYRGNEVGADLTEAERARVVERVREAAERFGIDVASGTRKTSPPPFRNREAATIGRSMARRDQRAEAKRLQRQAQVELLELEADLARLTAPASPAPEYKAVNVTTYASLEGIGEPIVKGDTL